MDLKNMNEKYYNKPKSMGHIQPPDADKIKELNQTGCGKSKSPEDIFRNDRKSSGAGFEKAQRFYKKFENHSEESDEGFPASEPAVKATGLKKGVKLGKVYISKGRILKYCIILIIVFAFIACAFPPVLISNIAKSGIDLNENPFEKMSLTELETYALSNGCVYSEQAFSSEKSDNYKVLKLVYQVKNYSPFKVKFSQFRVLHVKSDYKNKICFAANANVNDNGEVLDYEIPAFSSCEAEVEILMNTSGLSDKELQEEAASLIISANGMKKVLPGGAEIPAIPAVVWVSDKIDINTSQNF